MAHGVRKKQLFFNPKFQDCGMLNTIISRLEKRPGFGIPGLYSLCVIVVDKSCVVDGVGCFYFYKENTISCDKWRMFVNNNQAVDDIFCQCAT